MTANDLQVIARGLAPAIQEQLKARDDRIADLEARLRTLESRPATLKYCGIWDAADTYAIDEAVTFDGSLWIAREISKGERPGTNLHWQLAVKHARSRDKR